MCWVIHGIKSLSKLSFCTGEEIQTCCYYSVLDTWTEVCFLLVYSVKIKAKYNSFNYIAFEATWPASDFREKRFQCHSGPCSLAVVKFIPRKPRVNPLTQQGLLGIREDQNQINRTLELTVLHDHTQSLFLHILNYFYNLCSDLSAAPNNGIFLGLPTCLIFASQENIKNFISNQIYIFFNLFTMAKHTQDPETNNSSLLQP